MKFKERLEPILGSIKETMGEYHDYVFELEAIIMGFESSKDTDDFDCVLEQLYDFGDIQLDNKWPPTKMMWVGVAL